MKMHVGITWILFLSKFSEIPTFIMIFLLKKKIIGTASLSKNIWTAITQKISLLIFSQKKVRWTNIILFILLQSTLAVPQSVISMTNELKKVRTYLKQPIILLQPLLLWLVFPRNLTSHNLLRKILLWLRMNTGGLHGRFKPHNFIVHRIINWNYFIYYIIRVLFSFSISGLFYHFLLLFSILTAHFTFFPSLLVIIFSCFIWKKRLSYSIMI